MQVAKSERSEGLWAIVVKDGKREVISSIYESRRPSEVPAGYRVIAAPDGARVNMELLPDGSWGYPKAPRPEQRAAPAE